MRITKTVQYTAASIIAFVLGVQFAFAANHMASDRISDIVNTKHNFAALANPDLPSNDVGRQVQAATQNEVCVFCHTPHGDPNNATKPFLWNQAASVQTYTPYNSNSLNFGTDFATRSAIQPGEASKMCLSCHDGTVAVGSVDVINGRATNSGPEPREPQPTMTGAGINPDGTLVDSGTGRNSNLGFDLSNDHPIGFQYSESETDDEIYKLSEVDYIGRRTGSAVAVRNATIQAGGGTPDANNNPTSTATRIAVPLESSLTTALPGLADGVFATQTAGTVECTSCHDPHIRSTSDENIKFLRLHRFQKGSPSGVSFNIDQDINCLACHKKAGWATSAHATMSHADEIYDDTAADAREFPRGTTVWQASCLNCHDAHTEEGARYLLREGANVSNNSAIENTCYQCHSTNTALSDVNVGAKDIKFLNDLTGGHSLADFSIGANVHDIRNANQLEYPAELENRHVTCTDCHNPHRMVKNAEYDELSAKVQATHDHDGTAMHTNKASGSLRGTSGVEPDYPGVGDTFDPFNVVLKFTKDTGAQKIVGLDETVQLGGDPTTETEPTKVVTKEYQVCFKCHSNYGIPDADLTTNTKLNVAMEFQPADDVVGHADPQNHNSWHPVTGATGRTAGQDSLISPWNDSGVGNTYAGNQTMYCSDCHTSNDPTSAVGPHGSVNNKLLVGNWNQNTGTATPNDLCFSCHEYDQYANPATALGSLKSSGFSCAVSTDCKTNVPADSAYWQNLHIAHATKPDLNLSLGAPGNQAYECSLCHVKVPHGAKNKALLVNIGVVDAAQDAFYNFPNSTLSVDDFKASGQWVRSGSGASDNCASSGCHNIL
ncbi:MAG: hypothetical protein OEZ43_12210 [Gammaproteobacteria bacterium]|nr:hypothetical protein [Gammaproteobacteria bacterium]